MYKSLLNHIISRLSLDPNNRESLVVIKSNKNHGFQGPHLFLLSLFSDSRHPRHWPRSASVAACHKLIYETKVAKVVAQRQKRSLELDICIFDFDLAINVTKGALYGFEIGNYNFMRAQINGTQVDYQNCDNVYESYGKTNPLAKSTKHLKELASVGGYLASLIKKSF